VAEWSYCHPITTQEFTAKLHISSKLAQKSSLSCRYCGGRIGVALTTTAFVLMMVLLLQPKKPRFSQFTTTVFGLFYTSYLPVFWVKLRMLSVPAINSSECQLDLALFDISAELSASLCEACEGMYFW
jgi:Na+/melibiose symporter-like transporter